MTIDQALAVLRRAGFNPVRLDRERWPFLLDGDEEQWDPGHPLEDRGSEALTALPSAALIGLAASVLHVCSNPRSWAAFQHETRELYRVTRKRLN